MKWLKERNAKQQPMKIAGASEASSGRRSRLMSNPRSRSRVRAAAQVQQQNPQPNQRCIICRCKSISC